MSFEGCYEKRRSLERLSIIFGASVEYETILHYFHVPFSLSLSVRLPMVCRLKGFWWRDIDFKMRRRIQERRRF